MIEIEFFPKVNQRQTHSVQPLTKLLEWATKNKELQKRTLSYKQWLMANPDAMPKQKSDKKLLNFPAAIFAGTFTGTGKAEDIKKISGLFVLDFDHIDNLIEVRRKLENDPFTFLVFVSPSGDGLKVIIKHNLSDPLKWEYLYYELEDYYKKLFNGFYDQKGNHLSIDPSGKDISRMCFLPFIDNLYNNDNSDVWQYVGKFEKNETGKYVNIVHESVIEQNDNLYKECYYISAFLFENKIDITAGYGDWISYGYSLCALGESGREIFHNISCINEKYDNDECDQQYDYMLEHFDEDKTNIFIFLNNAKREIAHHNIYKKYGFLCL